MTFLTTSKMPRTLAERVEASVRGRKPARRLMKSLVRTVLVVVIAGVAVVGVRTKQREQREREAARVALLSTVRVEIASVTEDERKSVARIEALLLKLSSSKEADHVSPTELGTPERLRTLLARPAVYIRGPIESFTNAAGIDDVANESGKDALLACLFDPPSSRVEKVVLTKARVGSAHLEELSANVRRVGEARVGLPFLSPQYADSVKAAEDLDAIEKLSERFKKAPLARAKQALGAEMLIVAMDDTASGAGPTELDGARAHDVRFAIADIHSSSVLVWLKRRVDPSWVSVGQRAQHASELISCTLAMDLREAITR